ncbi:MAG: TerB family tellurite resistance protein [Chlorobi bacterium]|nr:TerB family tellurite resistance protein [Chlorobiota bacterium]
MNNSTISTELKSHFLRLFQMAMTDDEFSPEEWKMLYQFGEERGISADELDKILLNPTGDLTIPETVEKRIEYLYDLSRMIWADGKVTEDERRTLEKYCRKFEFLDENIPALTEYLLEAVKNGKSKNEILNELK